MIRFAPLVTKRLVRQPLRTLLTVVGVAVAMFLYCVVEATQAGVTRATAVVAGDSVLVVYRENRYCPFTSRLPQHYQPRIAQIPGVAHVVPMKILVSNCRASLDVVTFRGVPEQDFLETTLPDFEIVAGSAEAWSHRSDAALVGDALASRRAAHERRFGLHGLCREPGGRPEGWGGFGPPVAQGREQFEPGLHGAGA